MPVLAFLLIPCLDDFEGVVDKESPLDRVEAGPLLASFFSGFGFIPSVPPPFLVEVAILYIRTG